MKKLLTWVFSSIITLTGALAFLFYADHPNVAFLAIPSGVFLLYPALSWWKNAITKIMNRRKEKHA